MKIFYKILLLSLIMSCSPDKEAVQEEESTDKKENPSASGFNISGSDPRAIEIADSVVLAMGGRENYDNLRYLAWNFFGARDLIWDKKTDRVRIDIPAQKTTYLVNVSTMEGKAKVNDMEVTQPDSLQKHMQIAKEIWINDSYWLVMPFKLKDSGVTLKYAREDTLKSGLIMDVIELTFDGVGVNPENKYEVYVDRADRLVRQWAYFKDASQSTPSAVWPWDNYMEYNGVFLSANRSDGKGPHNIRVYEDLADATFESFRTPEFNF